MKKHHNNKINLRSKIGASFFLLLMITQLVITLANPKTVYAGPANEAISRTQKEINAKTAVRFIESCFEKNTDNYQAHKNDYDIAHDKHWKEERTFDLGNYTGDFYNSIAKKQKNGTYYIKCNDEAAIKSILSAFFKFDSIRAFMEELYPIDGGKCEGDKCFIQKKYENPGNSDIAQMLFDKLTPNQKGPNNNRGFSDAAYFLMLYKTLVDGECAIKFLNPANDEDKTTYNSVSGDKKLPGVKTIDFSTGDLKTTNITKALGNGRVVKDTGWDLRRQVDGLDGGVRGVVIDGGLGTTDSTTCVQLARALSNYAEKDTANSMLDFIKKLKDGCSASPEDFCDIPDTANPPALEQSTGQQGGADGESCEDRAKISAGWLVCSAVEMLSNGMDKMVGYIDDLLDVDVAGMDVNGELRDSWSYFRVVASFLLLAIGLVMVISQAIGGGGN